MMSNMQVEPSDHTPSKDQSDDAAVDQLLLDGVQQHSELALVALHERYGGVVRSLAASFVGNHARAEDVVIDVFMRCWNGEEAYDSNRGTAQAWLLNITRQQATALLTRPDAQGGADSTPEPISVDASISPEGAGGDSPARSLRDRLLARARGEDKLPEPPQSEPVVAHSPADQRPGPAFDPLPEPAAPNHPSTRTNLPPPLPRRAALEPIPSSRVPQRPQQRTIKLASLAWGTALLFVIATGLFVWAWSVTGPHASAIIELRARMPGGQIVTLIGASVPTAKARLYVFDGGKQAELSVDRLPAPPGGRTYQLWFAEPGEPFKSGGTIAVDASGDALSPVTLPAPLDRIRRISVTEEAAGGSANPSGAELLSWTP
jgi:DNA-directed RNA polymerase specialized sigma24 family protein